MKQKHSSFGKNAPALSGVTERLQKGGRVADVGCGHGASTVLMAQAFPASSFVGYDYHGPSIERARVAAQEAGLPEERARFEKHLRPLVERGGRPWRTQSSFTWAAKAPIPEGFWP